TAVIAMTGSPENRVNDMTRRRPPDRHATERSQHCNKPGRKMLARLLVSLTGPDGRRNGRGNGALGGEIMARGGSPPRAAEFRHLLRRRAVGRPLGGALDQDVALAQLQPLQDD